MPGIKELSSEYDMKGTSSCLLVKLDGKSTLRLEHKYPGNSGQLEATRGKWTFIYGFPGSMLGLEKKMETRVGDLKIKQILPRKDMWYMFPSPEIKLNANPLDIPKLKMKSNLELSYDFLQGFGRLEEELVFKDKYSAKLTMDSKEGVDGAHMALTAKLNEQHGESLGLEMTKRGGPLVRYEVRLNDERWQAKAEYTIKTKDVRLELRPKPFDEVQLSVAAIVNMGKSKQKAAPKFMLGAEYKV